MVLPRCPQLLRCVGQQSCAVKYVPILQFGFNQIFFRQFNKLRKLKGGEFCRRRAEGSDIKIESGELQVSRNAMLGKNSGSVKEMEMVEEVEEEKVKLLELKGMQVGVKSVQ